jgi:hypothetical protein
MGISIQEMFNKFKSILSDDTVFYAVLIILIAFSSFGLGRASVTAEVPQNKPKIGLGQQKANSVQAMQTQATNTAAAETKDQTSKGIEGRAAPNGAQTYVASKNGTKYHLLYCPGAKQIKETNKIYFSTKEEAQKAGYTPASNCKGI